MSNSPRQTWEQIPEKDPQFLPSVEPYAPLSATSNQQNNQQPAAKPFTVLSATELLAKEIPPKKSILGDGMIVMGQLTTLIGQGGTGKSRVAMQIALAQVLGWTFAGFKTHPEPLKHLLIGTENSIHRQQSDLRKMTAALDDQQRQQLGKSLFFHVVESIDDAFINIGSLEIRSKWQCTLEQIQPDCIYVDPFGEVNVGDINKDADVRATLRELTKLCRRHNHESAIVIIHHGRTGRQNIAQAVGWDKGNFALGSKALYSGSRSQINIAPADPEDSSKIILSCGKSNDAKPFDTVGLKLNEDTMLYDTDRHFDLNAWKDDVEGKHSGQSASIKDVILVLRDGAKTHTAICTAVINSTDCSKSTVKRRLADAIQKGYVRKTTDNTYFATQKALTL